jgi:hypothetical protein
MRFLVTLPANEQAEAAVMPSDDIITAMERFNDEMTKAGVLIASDGLHPTSRGARIRFSNGKTIVTDGPFTESKELIAGYWIIEVQSKEEAISWMRRAPFGGGVELTLREIFDREEFAALRTKS